jgi:hypothetical protein
MYHFHGFIALNHGNFHLSNTDIRECITFTEFLRKPQRNNGNIRIKFFIGYCKSKTICNYSMKRHSVGVMTLDRSLLPSYPDTYVLWIDLGYTIEHFCIQGNAYALI